MFYIILHKKPESHGRFGLYSAEGFVTQDLAKEKVNETFYDDIEWVNDKGSHRDHEFMIVAISVDFSPLFKGSKYENLY
jgi:hypothetical protein